MVVASTAMTQYTVLVESCQVQKISTVATGIIKSKPTATVQEVDQLLSEVADLINPNFKAWYCKRFATLGKESVLRYASQARADGKTPARLFSFLIK